MLALVKFSFQSTLQWGPWIWYQTVNVGIKSLKVCDYLGEHLASFFGITTPKYQYEIDEYERMIAEVRAWIGLLFSFSFLLHSLRYKNK